ncbi:hypothetical protein BDV18DRAFT_132540 [Aspergillus unguis]
MRSGHRRCRQMRMSGMYGAFLCMFGCRSILISYISIRRGRRIYRGSGGIGAVRRIGRTSVWRFRMQRHIWGRRLL